jgi:hypothetical protein
MLTRQIVEQPSRIRARERCLLVRTSRVGDEYRTKQKTALVSCAWMRRTSVQTRVLVVNVI